MGEFSIPHLLVLFLIILIFFGPGRLPALGKSLGEAIRGFKKGLEPNRSPQDSTENDGAKSSAASMPPPQLPGGAQRDVSNDFDLEDTRKKDRS